MNGSKDLCKQITLENLVDFGVAFAIEDTPESWSVIDERCVPEIERATQRLSLRNISMAYKKIGRLLYDKRPTVRDYAARVAGALIRSDPYFEPRAGTYDELFVLSIFLGDQVFLCSQTYETLPNLMGNARTDNEMLPRFRASLALLEADKRGLGEHTRFYYTFIYDNIVNTIRDKPELASVAQPYMDYLMEKIDRRVDLSTITP